MLDGNKCRKTNQVEVWEDRDGSGAGGGQIAIQIRMVRKSGN